VVLDPSFINPDHLSHRRIPLITHPVAPSINLEEVVKSESAKDFFTLSEYSAAAVRSEGAAEQSQAKRRVHAAGLKSEIAEAIIRAIPLFRASYSSHQVPDARRVFVFAET
jgi:hypothetical protein